MHQTFNNCGGKYLLSFVSVKSDLCQNITLLSQLSSARKSAPKSEKSISDIASLSRRREEKKSGKHDMIRRLREDRITSYMGKRG